MRWLVLLMLTVAACQEQFVFPDQFEAILQNLQLQHQQLQQQLQQQQQRLQQQQKRLQQQLEQQRLASGFLNLPTFQHQLESFRQLRVPTFAGIGAFPNNGPLATAPFLQTPVESTTSAKPFDTFLSPRWRERVVNIISRGVTKFTLDMDRAIQNSPASLSNDNLLFSPMSLTVTLAMVLLASGGKTFEEVAKILGFESGVDISHHSEIVHQIFGLLIQESERRQIRNPYSPRTKYAFGIFVEDDYPVREEFRAASEKIYKSEVLNVDFSHRNFEAQTILNNWVNDRTNGKIKNILTEPPSPLTHVIITSALYFIGEWEQPFSSQVTSRRPFYVEPDQTVFADMMVNGGTFPYYEDNELGLKIIGFPYRGNEMTMYTLLPNAPGSAGLRELKRRLTPEVLDGLINKMVNESCIVSYPRMKLSSSLHLRSALQALGLSSLFDPLTADLSVLSPGLKSVTGLRPIFGATLQQQIAVPRFGSDFQPCFGCRPFRRARRQTRAIDRDFIEFLNTQKLDDFGIDDLRNGAGISNPGLYAENVIHRVELTVNERGTEAVAATSLSLDRSGGYKWFTANRPFLFFIRDDTTQIISFWGNINRPTPFFNSA